jgi:two-component SAPR family response regulator
LSRFWEVRGYWSEGQRWLLELLARDETRASVERADESRLQRVKALYGAGVQAYYKYDMSAARALLEKSLQLAQAIEDPWWIALSLNMLNGTFIFSGTLANARPALEESVALARTTDDKWLLGLCLAYLGHAVRLQDYDAALPIIEESLRLVREAGDRITLCETLFIAANAALTWRKLERATELSQELVLVSLQIGRKMYDALGLYLQAGVLFLQGRNIEAIQMVRDGLVLAREAEEPKTIALGLSGLGIVVTALGQMKRAGRWFGASEAILLRAGIEIGAWAAPGTSFGPRYRESIAIVRSQLGEAAFAEAIQEGRAMNSGQAIEEALGVASELLKQAELAATVAVRQRAELTISALGATQVDRGEHLLTSSDWVYAKTRELFFYMLCNAPTTKEEVGLVFWPDASPAQLRRAFHRTLHDMRQALGRPDWILFDNEHYSFNRSRPYWFDVEAFESRLNQAHEIHQRQPDEAIHQLGEAIKLYRGDFLPEAESGEWVVLRREELRRRYLDALLALGQWSAAHGDHAQAVEYYRRAIAQDSYLEVAHRELMRAYARQGELSQALRHYRMLVDLMQNELGAPPAAETTQLYERLRTGGKP